MGRHTNCQWDNWSSEVTEHCASDPHTKLLGLLFHQAGKSEETCFMLEKVKRQKLHFDVGVFFKCAFYILQLNICLIVECAWTKVFDGLLLNQRCLFFPWELPNQELSGAKSELQGETVDVCLFYKRGCQPPYNSTLRRVQMCLFVQK